MANEGRCRRNGDEPAEIEERKGEKPVKTDFPRA
jgi:hypothetical protein